MQKNGIKTEGKLLYANENEMQLEIEKTEKNPETKKKYKITEQKKIPLAEVKQTKRMISFK